MNASIQKIISVEPVLDSDNLDKVQVLGWQVVTKRNQFKSNNLCIYVELDSILPDGPEWSEFMRPRGFRIKSIKLRKELSQGIVFPLEILPKELVDQGFIPGEGVDVSEILNILHYEKPIPANLRGYCRGSFPPFIPKTDELRVQGIPGVINELKGIDVYSTVKCDGTSSTYIYKSNTITNGYDFHICSRNNDLKITEENKDNVYVQMALKYDIENQLHKLGMNIAIQGEICGPGIQKNHMCLKEFELFIFNVYKIDERCYSDYDEFIEIVKTLGLKTVPIIGKWAFNHTQEQLLEMSRGFYDGTKNRREGIVIRPTKEMYSSACKGRLSFKVLNNEYLLKDEE